MGKACRLSRTFPGFLKEGFLEVLGVASAAWWEETGEAP